MEAKIIKVDKQNLDPEVMREAGSMIRMGGLVAFPTETVYGLGADARQKDAASRIYAAKGRPSDNPLIVHRGISGAAGDRKRYSGKGRAAGPDVLAGPADDDPE